MILIVDDDQEYVEELRGLLLRSGHNRVEAAATASEAFTMIEQCTPEVVILDLMLPESPDDPTGSRFPEHNEETTGVRLARKLKAAGFDMRRVVGITTLSADKDLCPLRGLGIDAILFKPVPFSRILEAIKKARLAGGD